MGRQVGHWGSKLTGAVGMALIATGAQAQSEANEGDATQLDTVVVTATRQAQSAFDVPASVNAVGEDTLHGKIMGVSVSEVLQDIPGLLARDRQNYAQDTQISIRGFGARSTFGIRGIRLYVDGIPATQPDGQGQVSHFNLSSAERVEVLRGPFSALYGNSSGGVIQIFTADGTPEPQIGTAASVGSFDTWRTSIDARGPLGERVDYNIDYTHFETDGFRDHSAALRNSINGKVNLHASANSTLSLVFNSLSAPDAQDPLGLTREQFDEDPSQADQVAIDFNTRKSVSQQQGGLLYEYRLSDQQSIHAMAYAGNRQITQFLSIPTFPQANPLHSGGVVDLDSDYGGGDLRWNFNTSLADRPLRLVAGLTYDTLSQDRLGYENFVGDTLGVQGALRRDETNEVEDFDQYAQLGWDLMPRLTLQAGVRHAAVDFDFNDHYITTSNPDDSGSVDYSATLPVIGALFRATAKLNLYAAYGSGFETPTIAELAYRSDGQSGPNLDLDAPRSRNAEVGAKWRPRIGTQVEVAAFETRTDNEIVVATNSGGRTTYTNADRTRRRGAEASVTTDLPLGLRLDLAYTWLEAEVRDTYSICTGTPCTSATTEVAAGSKLPGVPEGSLYSALQWGSPVGFNAEISARYLDAVPVNDVNSESAPSYTLVGANIGYGFELPHWSVRTFVRMDNLFDVDYVGSVIVNDGNGRYYEPGPDRTVMAGFRADWKI